MEIVNLLLPIITLILGSWLTYTLQGKNFEKTRKWDQEKLESQFKQERERLQEQFNYDSEKQKKTFFREQLIRKMESYNVILKTMGENKVVEYPRYHEEEPEFNNEIYTEKVRPVLYESFHLLNEDVAGDIIKIDKVFEEWDYNEEVGEGQSDLVTHYYENIKKVIQEELEDFRRNFD